jgi:hypothetical protein
MRYFQFYIKAKKYMMSANIRLTVKNSFDFELCDGGKDTEYDNMKLNETMIAISYKFGGPLGFNMYTLDPSTQMISTSTEPTNIFVDNWSNMVMTILGRLHDPDHFLTDPYEMIIHIDNTISCPNGGYHHHVNCYIQRLSGANGYVMSTIRLSSYECKILDSVFDGYGSIENLCQNGCLCSRICTYNWSMGCDKKAWDKYQTIRSLVDGFKIRVNEVPFICSIIDIRAKLYAYKSTNMVNVAEFKKLETLYRSTLESKNNIEKRYNELLQKTMCDKTVPELLFKNDELRNALECQIMINGSLRADSEDTETTIDKLTLTVAKLETDLVDEQKRTLDAIDECITVKGELERSKEDVLIEQERLNEALADWSSTKAALEKLKVESKKQIDLLQSTIVRLDREVSSLTLQLRDTERILNEYKLREQTPATPSV